jgi:thiamine pyrophosphate-dependent acetolactate synthase large subunit-like protein
MAAFAPHRGDAIVIPGRAARHWREYGDGVFDLPLGDPAMGGRAGFSLGLALAQPSRRVVVFDSEGDLLMNLGVLATIAELAPANFYHFLLDNECYATTGGQPVPNAHGMAYDVVARGCGITRTYAFSDPAELSRGMAGILAAPGPVFAWAKVRPEIENRPIGERPASPGPGPAAVVAKLREALGGRG